MYWGFAAGLWVASVVPLLLLSQVEDDLLADGYSVNQV